MNSIVRHSTFCILMGCLNSIVYELFVVPFPIRGFIFHYLWGRHDSCCMVVGFKLWVRIPLMARDIRYYIMGWSLARDIPVFATEKTDRHDTTGILLKMALNKPTLTQYFCFKMYLVLVCLCTSIEHFVVNHYNFTLKPHNCEP